jgi:hypothetical protein
MLETSECIEITNNGRTYTDCMEFSLLRFLQLCTYDLNQMITNNFSFYPNSIIYNNLLNNFINKYPIIYQDTAFYELSENGKLQRQSWANFVSDKNFLDYYRYDSAKLFTSVRNIIKFFNGFFRLALNINNHQESLDKISKIFSNDKKKISLKIKYIDKQKMYLRMKEIMRYISRPETEYILHIKNKELYEIITSKTFIDIKIDGFRYEWVLSEMYFSDPNLFENKFITGHSVIYNLDLNDI